MNENILKGIAASDGIAIGPAFSYVVPDLKIPTRKPEPAEQELLRFANACQQANSELRNLFETVARRAGEEEARIFEAHQMILDDPLLKDKVEQFVQEGNIIEQAVRAATEELAAMLSTMQDELFAARALDVKDIGQRLLRILLDLPDTSFRNLTAPAIIVAMDLTPSDTASLDPDVTLGFCTASGGLTSHTAILARSLGIPAIVGMGEALMSAVSNNTPLIMDGHEGRLVIDPGEEAVQKYEHIRQERLSRFEKISALTHEPARTGDGRRMEVAANIGDAASASDAVANGAEGIGLLRTEFLYLDETQPPSEQKQYQAYRSIFEIMGERPVIVRTLDIGGDKPPAYLPFPEELNPFLGWRAIRISLDEPGLFKTQLRAILRAAVGYDIRIMLPMVTSLDEIHRTREILKEVKDELRRDNLPFAEDLPLGIMVETPAAALLVDVFAEAVDFYSLGTNDLTQYTLAVDRGNARVADLYQPLHPAVLRLIKHSIELAHGKGKWIGMCGELAGMPLAIPILLGMGLDEFSMTPRAIPEAKHLIRQLTDEQARAITEQALQFGTAGEVEQFMKEVLKSLS